jgi:hypothetical protein
MKTLEKIVKDLFKKPENYRDSKRLILRIDWEPGTGTYTLTCLKSDFNIKDIAVINPASNAVYCVIAFKMGVVNTNRTILTLNKAAAVASDPPVNLDQPGIVAYDDPDTQFVTFNTGEFGTPLSWTLYIETFNKNSDQYVLSTFNV